MKTRQRRPRKPQGETLSMDWFTEALEDSLDKSLQEDPHGCHSNLQEHQAAVENCVGNLRLFHITNPYQFLNRWSTSEILGGLDTLLGQELQGNVVQHPAGWLWNYLEKGEAAVLEPAGYPERSAEVVNSIARQLQLRGFSHPAYLVTTYPLEDILEAINAADEVVKRLEVKDVPGLITSLVEGGTGEIAEREGPMAKRETLTPTEIDTLRLIARGHTTEEICGELKISEHTLIGRLNSILSKLGARNRAHAVALALRRGILSEEDVNGQGES